MAYDLTTAAEDRAPAGNRFRRPQRAPFRTTVQVVGELLITVAVLMMMFVVWQLWWTNLEARGAQTAVVETLSQEFATPVETSEADSNRNEPVVGVRPADGESFGIVYIPRFGEDYSVPLSAGVNNIVLDSLGLGMYPGSAMPGDVGNFSVAGHRQTHGKVLDLVHTLESGDKIYVRTVDGYYTYVFRDFEIVTPDRSDVLLPVPKNPEAEPTERLLTMTTCHPRYGDQERFIAYSVLESWQPASAGPPAEISELVEQS